MHSLLYYFSAIKGSHRDNEKGKTFVGVMQGWWNRCRYDYNVWLEKVTHKLMMVSVRWYLRVLQTFGRAPAIEEMKEFTESQSKKWVFCLIFLLKCC